MPLILTLTLVADAEEGQGIPDSQRKVVMTGWGSSALLSSSSPALTWTLALQPSR